MIAEGDSLIEIAQKLHRSQKTIESHRLSIGRKLKASNRVELTKIAIAHGLVSIGQPQGMASTGIASMAEQELSWLERINNTIANAAGATLLDRFCEAASQLPSVSIAAICMPERTSAGEPIPHNRVVMAIADQGQMLEPLRYHAAQTPCQDVIRKGECWILANVCKVYPEDAWLKQIGAESYVGIQLLNAESKAVGGVGLIGREPMREVEALRKVIDFFAPRLASALETTLQINALRSQLDHLASEAVEVGPETIAATLPEEMRSALPAIAQLMRGVHALAGAGFLRGIVDCMAEAFDLSHIGLSVIDPAFSNLKLRTVVFRVDGQIVDDVSYTAMDAPCKLAVEQGHYFVGEHAGAAFPKDELFVKNEISSYLGIRLPGPNNEVVGLMWMGRRRAFPDYEIALHAAKYFAPRIGAELLNQQRIERLLQERDRHEAGLLE